MFCLSEVSIELLCLRHGVPEALKRLPWQWGVYLCSGMSQLMKPSSSPTTTSCDGRLPGTRLNLSFGQAWRRCRLYTLPLPNYFRYCYYCYYYYDYYIPSTFLSTTCSRFRERHHQSSSSISTSNCFRSARAPQPAITRADDVWVVA